MLRKSLSSGVALVATMSAAAVLLVGLSGCGLVTNAALQQEAAACKAQGGTPTQQADCVNRVESQIVGRAPDLVNLHMAARRALAEKIERHEISEAEAEFEFAKLGVDIEQIHAGRTQTNLQTSADLMNASAALARAGAPQTLGSPVINTNCTGGSGYWNCQSH
jgi:hypothetical protein